MSAEKVPWMLLPLVRRHWILALAVFFYVAFSLALLETYPPPFPDEMLFAATANSFLDTGRIATPQVLGLEQGTYWLPPLHTLVVAWLFSVFGSSLSVLRLFSISCGVFSILLVYMIARELSIERGISVATVFLMVLDPHFLRFSKIGRLDMLCVVLILLAILLSIRWLHERKETWQWGSAAFGALALLTHPFGVVVPLGLLAHRVVFARRIGITGRGVYFPMLAVLPVILLIVIAGVAKTTQVLEQLGYQFTRNMDKAIGQGAWNWVTRYTMLPGFLVLSVLGTLGACYAQTRQGWHKSEGCVLIVGILSFMISVWFFQLFYPVYYIPFVALAVAVTCQYVKGLNHERLFSAAALLVLLALLNGLLYNAYFFSLYKSALTDGTSTEKLTQSLSQHVPHNVTVMLIGSPCLYFELDKSRKDLRILDEIALNENRGEQVASITDYVIVTEAYRKSYSDFIAQELGRWQQRFAKVGKRLLLAGTAGPDKPYAYRGRVYEAIQISDAP
jgi:4-amino-4-deoxy-L-arabinose transferase-like glycosyltransferase